MEVTAKNYMTNTKANKMWPSIVSSMRSQSAGWMKYGKRAYEGAVLNDF